MFCFLFLLEQVVLFNFLLSKMNLFWVVFFILSHMSYLYILEINPLSVSSFANIFLHSVGYLFILFMVSFAVQKLLSLIRSHLFIFVFISITLGDRTKRNCCNLCQRVFCLCFPLRIL